MSPDGYTHTMASHHMLSSGDSHKNPWSNELVVGSRYNLNIAEHTSLSGDRFNAGTYQAKLIDISHINGIYFLGLDFGFGVARFVMADHILSMNSI